MALRDKGCYTLSLVPSLRDPNVLELVEAGVGLKGETRYARVRETREGEVYSSILYDAHSGAKLASTGYVSEKIKSRRLELHGPDESIPFEFTGRLGFEWTFTFEGNKYRWKRDGFGQDMICSLERKPDPSVEMCLASREQMQILHYNVDRFRGSEIVDLRGLETLFVMSILCLYDAIDLRGAPAPGIARTAHRKVSGSGAGGGGASGSAASSPVEGEDLEPDNPNEIIVGVASDIDGHIARALALLGDASVLFIIIRTKRAEAAQRALEVSLGVTRFRHREGLPNLHQYVVEEKVDKPGPKVIKLDDPTPTQKWQPPPNLSIYLSTIELPDLVPISRSSKPKPKPKPKPHGHDAPDRLSPTGSPAPSGSSGGRRTSGTGPAPPPKQSPPVPPHVPQRPNGSGSGSGSGGKQGDRESRIGKLFRPAWK